MPNLHPLQQAAPGAGPLSPERKRFNKLLERLDRLRAKLQAWDVERARCAQQHAEHLVPLEQAMRTEQRRWAELLDTLLGEKGWRPAERETMTEVLLDTVDELMAEAPDDELRALYDRHAEVDFATLEAQNLQDMHEMARAMTGLDLGDEPVGSPDELLERMAQAMAQAQDPPGGPGAHGTGLPPEATGRRKKRPKRKSAAEQRREEEAAQSLQSVREIYRKLASALHPDRETDPAERERKTRLMQRANDAQGRNDLLALLELQLEIEQVQPGSNASIGDDRLRAYNRVLADQVRSLEVEVEHRAIEFCETFGWMSARRPEPNQLAAAILQSRLQMQRDLEALRRTIARSFDKSSFKQWLKAERRRREEDEDGFGFMPF